MIELPKHTGSSKGIDVVLDEDAFNESFQRTKSQWSPHRHYPLQPPQTEIVRNTIARMVGHDNAGAWVGREQYDKDLEAVVAMNNSLVLSPHDLENALKESKAENTDVKTLKDYAENGFHTTNVTRALIHKLLKRKTKGYSFLMEHQADGLATPIAYQFGFSVIPSSAYRSLSLKSLPELSVFTENVESTMSIWRTGVLRTVNSVRTKFEEIGIGIHPNLENQMLHRIGIGQATKLVVATAAEDLDKIAVQCNIGTVVRPNNQKDILVQNLASRGSNEEVFNKTDFSRLYTDRITSDSGIPLVEIYWRLYRSTPQEMIAKLKKNDSGITVKGWNLERLQKSGHQLADVIRRDPSSK